MTKVQCVNCGNLTDANQPCGSCWCPNPRAVDYTLGKVVGFSLDRANPKAQGVDVRLDINVARALIAKDNARLHFIRMIAGLATYDDGGTRLVTVNFLVKTAR